MIEQGTGCTLHAGESVFDEEAEKRPSDNFGRQLPRFAGKGRTFAPETEGQDFSERPQNSKLDSGGEERICGYPTDIRFQDITPNFPSYCRNNV